MTKILSYFIFFILFYGQLFALNYQFSIDDGSINIKKDRKIDILFDKPAYKIDTNISDDFLDEKYIKNITIFKENNINGTSIPFLVDIPKEDDVLDSDSYTISIKPQEIKSSQKYFLKFQGTKVQDYLNDIAEDKNTSFTMENFIDIKSPKEINIGIRQSKTFKITLNKAPSFDDVIVGLTSNSEDIIISPSSATLNDLNYMDGVNINISSTNNLSLDKNYSITAKSDSIKAKNIIKVIPKDENVNFYIKDDGKVFESNVSHKFSVKIINPILSNYDISIISDNNKIILSKSTLTFTKANYSTYQDILINASSITKDTNASIKLNLGDVNKSFIVQAIMPKVAEVPKDTKPIDTNNSIKILSINSLSAVISWKADKNFESNFSIYIGASLSDLDAKIGETNESLYVINHKPNRKYALGIQYTISKIVLGKIEIPAQAINLTDSNKNGLSDDLEKLVGSDIDKTDSNNDGVPDTVQYYLAFLNKSTNINTYTLHNDIDGDKVPDIFELNVGRNPVVKDFNGDKNLELIVGQDGKNILVLNFMSDFPKIIEGAGVSSNKVGKATIGAYIGDGCLSNDVLVANYLYKSDCQDMKTLVFKEGNYNVVWVGLDDVGNIAYKKQVLSITKKVNTGGEGNNKIIFHSCENNHPFCAIDFSIKSDGSTSLSFGLISAGKNQKNPILLEKDVLASEWDFTNDIFDIRIGTNTGSASVLLSQIKPISSGSVFRIFKNNAWQNFNTANGDSISTSGTINRDCFFNNTYSKGVYEDHLCVKLNIQDGGINDSDGIKNGLVSLIGGISTKEINININDSSSTGCSSLHAGGFDENKNKAPRVDYLMIFIFLISFVWVVRMFLSPNKNV